MRKNILFVFGILFILIFSLFFVSGGRFFLDVFSPKNSVSSLEKGLVGHWTLDEINYNPNTNRVTDKSAYSNHGINSGATFTTDRMGNIGGAMSFDGVDDSVTVNNGLISGTNNFTISMWVKREIGVSYYPIFDFGTSPTHGLSLHGPGINRLQGGDGNGNSFDLSSGFGTSLTSGVWYHVVIAYDDLIFKKYLNSNYDASYIWTHGVGNPTSFTIGDFWGPNYKGLISDVRIYNRVLSADEIKLLYDQYKPKVVSSSLQSGLVLDMPLTDTYMKSSNIVTDRTPYSNDGVVNGAIVGNDYTSFDGNDWVDLSNDLGYDSTFSIFTWFKSSGAPPGNYHIILGGDQLELSIPVSGQIRSGLYTTSGRYVSNHGSGLTDGNWHFVGFIFDGANKKSYIDGMFVGNQGVIGTLTSSFSDRKIGRFGSSSTYFLNGHLSNLKIYNRALSEEEVKSLYEKGRI